MAKLKDNKAVAGEPLVYDQLYIKRIEIGSSKPKQNGKVRHHWFMDFQRYAISQNGKLVFNPVTERIRVRNYLDDPAADPAIIDAVLAAAQKLFNRDPAFDVEIT